MIGKMLRIGLGITCGIRQPTGRKFHPIQPPVGPVGSWDGLEVVRGVQLGHRATWFGGGRARPAPAPAPLPPPRTSGWRPASKAVRLFGSQAIGTDASTCPGMGCYTAKNFSSFLPSREVFSPSLQILTISTLSHNLFLGEAREKGPELHDLCGILVRGNYVTSRCLGLRMLFMSTKPAAQEKTRPNSAD
jgi:hypothetical protein